MFGGFLSKFVLSINSVTNELKKDYASFFLIILLPPIIYEGAINIDKVNF